MNSNQQVLTLLNNSTQQIIDIIHQTQENRFNLRQDQRWSVSDCLEHLIIVEQYILGVLNGETEPLRDRQPDEFVPQIESRFTQREQKFEAPAPLSPQHEERGREIQKQTFIKIRAQLASALERLDLTTLLCIGQKHRIFGALTPYEWAYFTIYHSDRHALQMTEVSAQST